MREISQEFRYRSEIRLITTKDLERNDPYVEVRTGGCDELTHIDREVAVSYGAILRAWNKEDGPARFIQSSYGFEIMEEYNPKRYPEHLQVKKKYKDKLDGKTYVEEVIEWHVCKVCSSSAVPAVQYAYLITSENRRSQFAG